MSIRVFVTEWCGHCKTQLPEIRAAANKLGATVQITDIDRCPVNLKQKCSSIDFVPHIEFNGKTVSVDQLRNMASKR